MTGSKLPSGLNGKLMLTRKCLLDLSIHELHFREKWTQHSKNFSIVVYLDDITVFSKKRSNHLDDLKQIFECCRRYGISLNPKKSFFALNQGNFLGFIVSKYGIYIDPDRIREISKISFPHNKKSMQSFLGQIIFFKRFVPYFSHIILPLQMMIKKKFSIQVGITSKKGI